MTGINISDIAKKTQSGNQKRGRRALPNLSEISSDYSNSTKKVDQKWVKSGSKVDHKVDQKRIKSRSKVDQELPPAHTTAQESRSKVGLKVDHEVDQKRIKSRSKVDQNCSIFQLVGLQKNILLVLFEDYLNRNQSEGEYYNLTYLSERLNRSKASVKSAIRQLLLKGFILKKDFKDGRGGGTKYQIPNLIYRDLLNESRSKVDQKWVKSGSKVGSEVDHKVDQNGPSSSSINILNTTTTRANISEVISIPETLLSCGFKTSHVNQLAEKFSLEADQIQEGLEAFAYDLDHGEMDRLKSRGIQNIIGYFFGAMKNGGYNSTKEGFIPAEELAEQEMLERLEKRKKEKQQRKQQLQELLFEEWLETKSEEELVQINQPALNFMDSIHRASLKGYFIDNEFEEFQKGFS